MSENFIPYHGKEDEKPRSKSPYMLISAELIRLDGKAANKEQLMALARLCEAKDGRLIAHVRFHNAMIKVESKLKNRGYRMIEQSDKYSALPV